MSLSRIDQALELAKRFSPTSQYTSNREGANPPNPTAFYNTIGMNTNLNGNRVGDSNPTNYQYQQIPGYPSGATAQAVLTPHAYTALTGNIYKAPPAQSGPVGGPQRQWDTGASVPFNNSFDSFFTSSSGAPKSSSPSSSESSSTSRSYSPSGSYGGGGYSPPPPPMPAFHAKAPTFDRYGGREWNPDDPGNVTPIDMGERPVPYARDVAKYKKLLGEEV